MEQQSKRVALPAYLRRRLQVFHVGEGAEQSFVIKDQLTNKTFQLEPWQFFILEILPGCDSFSKLESIFTDRFGRPITKDKVDELFSTVAENGLWGIGADSHPMLSPYFKKGVMAVDVNKQSRPGQNAKSEIKDTGVAETTPSPKATSAGVQDVRDPDENWNFFMLELFDPRPLLKFLQPLLSPFRYAIYLLPLLVISALLTSIRYADLILLEVQQIRSTESIIGHALFGMFTVNLLVTLVTAVVAYSYRATVSAICIVFLMGILPRFYPKVSYTEQLSRRERIWLHASPLLLRLGLFSVGILIWFGNRDMHSTLAQFSLALSSVCTIDLLVFSANPLVKGAGYRLLATLLNEPKLLGKSYLAFFNKLKGNTYSKSDNSILAAYALATLIYGFLLSVAAVIIVGQWMAVEFGGARIILIAALGAYLLWRFIRKLKIIEEAYDRTIQFERWRKRTLTQEERAGVEVKETPNTFTSYIKKALPFTLLIILFLPYSYEPGGNFTITSVTQQNLTTDIDGTIAEVNFDGGEELKKGTVIARLSTDDYQNQVNIYKARMREQQSVINDLKSRPKPEEVKLAESELQVAITQEMFSKGKAERSKKLYADGAISYEEMDKAVREYQVDSSQVAQRRANLALIEAGVTPDVIEAAEGKLQGFKEEQDLYQDKINRSFIRMPFDGVLVGSQLKQKIGSFLEKGKQLAIVEQTDNAVAEIDVAESDIGYVVNAAKVVVRPEAYPNVDFTGTVFQIDKNVTSQSSGKVVKVYTLLGNKDGRLKAGMTGYGKIDGGTLMVWEAFSLAIVRFIQVELWSWIP